jgi:hypothetical protein
MTQTTEYVTEEFMFADQNLTNSRLNQVCFVSSCILSFLNFTTKLTITAFTSLQYM